MLHFARNILWAGSSDTTLVSIAYIALLFTYIISNNCFERKMKEWYQTRLAIVAVNCSDIAAPFEPAHATPHTLLCS